MKTDEREKINMLYYEQLQRQQFVAEELDYAVFEIHRPVLRTLAALGNSGISVYDMFKKEHLFYSPNFCAALGYDMSEVVADGQQYLDSRIHPDDHLILMKNGILLLKMFSKLPGNEKAHYKLINEYRILNAEDKYVRVIEQHQVLELDNYGNIWLSFSIIDVSPSQDVDDTVRTQLLNFKTGKIIPFTEEDTRPVNDLTQREREILQMVKEGLLSKEISDKLSISVHTVNTHRQRVLEKLGANNSMEAVSFASKSGLLV